MLYGVNHLAVCCLDTDKINYKGIKDAALYLLIIDVTIAYYNTDRFKLFYKILIPQLPEKLLLGYQI
ncbi:hypothetical protein CK503_06400 [Aliifodinibius salipaludis]|uniref:Uncharacterized protein n=1 Tax=Fodinibius salipaludis TaxID=2032627 RepID=A0A2A2GAQ5_9BACT|nr:hypothetical protein CK503_06400 [Aliifodinibius salipaludis]